MANFAPAYHHESNSAWLDHLIGDVMDPNQRANCRTYGQDWDDDMVDDPDYESPNEEAQDDLEKQSDGSISHRLSESTSQAGPAAAVPSRTSSIRTARSRSRSTRVPGSPGMSAYRQVTQSMKPVEEKINLWQWASTRWLSQRPCISNVSIHLQSTQQ